MESTSRSRFPSIVAAFVVGAVAIGGCSSSSSGSSSTSLAVTTTQPTDTIPTEFRAACALLADEIVITAVRPNRTSDWPSERDRVVTAARHDADVYRRAIAVVPADIAEQLPLLVDFVTAMADGTANAATFDDAVTAIAAIPDNFRPSLAMATVETWKRTNCRS